MKRSWRTKMTKLRTIYGKNKTAQQLQMQIKDASRDANILITELDPDTWFQLYDYRDQMSCPGDLLTLFNYTSLQDNPVYIASCECGVIVRNTYLSDLKVAITSAGIADRKIVDEAGLTVLLHGYTPKFFNDIGVNDLKKTTDSVDEINKCRAIISVQGFEGALPVVLAGLTSLPIVSVPTSTGYGVSAKGYTALNTSLSSCTSGISVVNINNGFGAGEAVVRILDVIGNES